MNEDLQEALKRRREAFEQEEEVLGATDELEVFTFLTFYYSLFFLKFSD